MKNIILYPPALLTIHSNSSNNPSFLSFETSFFFQSLFGFSEFVFFHYIILNSIFYKIRFCTARRNSPLLLGSQHPNPIQKNIFFTLDRCSICFKIFVRFVFHEEFYWLIFSLLNLNLAYFFLVLCTNGSISQRSVISRTLVYIWKMGSSSVC